VISDDDVEKALEYLRDSAKQAAIARSQAKTLEKYLGVIEAVQKSLHRSESNARAQDMARASPEYREALEGWQEAVRRDCEYTMLREAASSRIEAWRSMSANNRGMERIR
jgi:vacuolar-type H+-ATPase subunit I/STV1